MLPDKALKTKCSAFLYNAPRLPKENCFLESYQASPLCPFGKNNIQTKVNMELIQTSLFSTNCTIFSFLPLNLKLNIAQIVGDKVVCEYEALEE
jgi:hypothetical protein